MEALVNSLGPNAGGDTAALSREQLEAEHVLVRPDRRAVAPGDGDVPEAREGLAWGSRPTRRRARAARCASRSPWVTGSELPLDPGPLFIINNIIRNLSTANEEQRKLLWQARKEDCKGLRNALGLRSR